MTRILHQTLVIVCCLGAALFAALKGLQAIDYGYDFWYEQLDIPAHIAKYAPQNRQGKLGFATTERSQHEELFKAIAVAVNDGGRGLRELSYRARGAGTATILLTDAEATHLEDVARLIGLGTIVGWGALILLLALLIVSRLLRVPLPGPGTALLTLLVLVAIISATIGLIGPHDVFQALHVAAFPADHQWFFYYQDSLMTTLMKAPDIFFAIGAAWGLRAAVLFVAISLLLRALIPGIGRQSAE